MQKYYIALIPDLVITKEVLELKLIAKDKFVLTKALRSPAHIKILFIIKFCSKCDLYQNKKICF